jgi:hypothetical protein
MMPAKPCGGLILSGDAGKADISGHIEIKWKKEK